MLKGKLFRQEDLAFIQASVPSIIEFLFENGMFEGELEGLDL
jgi:hypothetical protein